jgi:LPXTG-site transpeptidase (sortase) family protein
MKTILAKALTAALSAMSAAVLILTPAALAADYSFDAKDKDDFYTPTPYKEVYGSEYIYGGVNLMDIYDSSLLPGIFAPSPENAVYGGSGYYESGYAASYGTDYESEYSPDFNADFITNYSPDHAPAYTAAPFTPASTLARPDGSVGTLEIPPLGISVKAFEGTDSDSLSKGVGHFPESSGWNGNICVAGHNRGAKYTIGAIKDLTPGDTVKYTTLLGTRTYSVSFVRYIASGDWTYLAPASDNRITIITCLAGHPELRVCVQAVETT